MELPLALVALAGLLTLAWAAPTAVAWLFLGALATGAVAVSIALVARARSR